jgi:hypothetical protein
MALTAAAAASHVPPPTSSPKAPGRPQQQQQNQTPQQASAASGALELSVPLRLGVPVKVASTGQLSTVDLVVRLSLDTNQVSKACHLRFSIDSICNRFALLANITLGDSALSRQAGTLRVCSCAASSCGLWNALCRLTGQVLRALVATLPPLAAPPPLQLPAGLQSRVPSDEGWVEQEAWGSHLQAAGR